MRIDVALSGLPFRSPKPRLVLRDRQMGMQFDHSVFSLHNAPGRYLVISVRESQTRSIRGLREHTLRCPRAVTRRHKLCRDCCKIAAVYRQDSIRIPNCALSAVTALTLLSACGSSSGAPSGGPQTGHSQGPAILATGQGGGEQIGLDAAHVYWVDTTADGNSSVMNAPIGGGSPTTLASGMRIAVGGGGSLSIDSSGIYVIDLSQPGVTTNGSIMKVGLSGGAPTVLYQDPNSGELQDIAINATAIFCYDAVPPTLGPPSGLISIPLGGGSASMLYQLASTDNGIVAVAADASTVYFAVEEAGSAPTYNIMKVNTTGGAPALITTIPSGLGSVENLAVDGTAIYMTVGGAADSGGAVMKAPLSGGTATTLASGPITGGAGLAIDDTNVYWTAFAGVMKVAKAGGTTTIIGPGEGSQGVAVDATSVYWTDGDGNVRKAAK